MFGNASRMKHKLMIFDFFVSHIFVIEFYKLTRLTKKRIHLLFLFEVKLFYFVKVACSDIISAFFDECNWLNNR